MNRALARGLWVLGLAAVVAVVAIAVRAQPAGADADPASDTLLVQDAFFPYTPATPAGLQRELETALKEIHATGLDLKVAVIGSPVDLGGIPALFGQPGRYARFLDTEISSRTAQPLLVVMPQGLSVQGVPTSVAGVAVDHVHGSGGLVQAAIDAVRRIAAGRGQPIAAVQTASAGSGGGPVVVLVVAALVLVLVAVGAVVRARAGTRRSGAAARR